MSDKYYKKRKEPPTGEKLKMNNKENDFNYRYSAEKLQEVESIRQKYIRKEEDSLERLRRLDASVAKKASALSLVIGILGTILLGFGMSLVMSELGELFGKTALPLGIVLGVLGIVILSLAYPVYIHTLKRERERIAPEILKLTDELMK